MRRGRMRKELPNSSRAAIAVLAFILVASSTAVVPAAGARGQTGVYIDPLPFYNSVPHQMLLGHSYRLIVVLINNGTSSQSGSVVVSFDQDYFFTSNPVAPFQLPPGDMSALNFTIVATNPAVSTLSVTCTLVQTQGLQNVAVQVVTASVGSITRDPVVYTYLYLAAASSALVLVAAVYLAWRSRRRSRGQEFQ